MSFIPGDPNTSQRQKIHIERQSTESSSNNESFKSTPTGSPDLSLFTPKDNNGDIKIKSFVAASGSDDFLYDSDYSENNSQKRVKVSTPLQKMKKSQQDFPEKRHKHHNKPNTNSTSSNAQITNSKSKSNSHKNIISREININEDENPLAEFGDQSPKMLSSSSVQTGEENIGHKKQNTQHEVLMVPRTKGNKKIKLVDTATQVKYHIVNKNEAPELKVETVQTPNTDQFEIDFDDTDEKAINSKTKREDNKVNDKMKSPKPHLDNDIIQSPKERNIEIKNSDNRKSPKRNDEFDKEYDKRKSPRHNEENERKASPRHRRENDRDYNQKKSPRHRDEYESEDYDKQRSPKHRYDNEREYDHRKSPRHRHEDDQEYDRRRSPKHHHDDEREYDHRKSPRSPRHHHDDDQEYDRSRSPRHRREYEDEDYDRRKSPRHRREYEDEDYDRRKSPRHRRDYEDEDYDRRKSPRHRHEYEYDDYDRQKSPKHRHEYEDDDYGRRKSPRHRYEDEDYDRRKSPRHRNEDDRRKSPRNRYDDDRRKSPRHRNDYENNKNNNQKSPKNRNKNLDKDSRDNKAKVEQKNDAIQNEKQLINNQQDFSSSNSIDRLADSIQPNTLTIRDIPIDDTYQIESPTKATQTIENDVFERDFELPENEVDESGEGLRLLSSIFNDVSSSSIAPNNDTVGHSYQQRISESIEKAKMLREITFPKPPKLADISIQNDMSEDEMQEDLLSSSFDKRLQEVDLENDNNLVQERNVNLKFIQQKQDLSEGSENSNNESFNFLLSENDDDESKQNQAVAQRAPSKVKLSTDNIDLGKYSSKASLRSKSGDFTIAPNFTEDSLSSIQQPPESEKNLMPLSEGLQAIEASVDQTKTKETLSAAMSSIDLYTEITEEEEEPDSQSENTNKYSFGENVKERGFGQFKLNIHSDSSKKSQRSEANPNDLKNGNSYSDMSDIPKSPRTHESMLSNEKLLSQSSDSKESHHSNASNKSNQSHQSSKSNQSAKSNQSHQSNNSHQSNQSAKSNQSHQSNNSHQSNQSAKSNQSHQSNQSAKSNQSHQSNQSNNSHQSAKSNQSHQSNQSNNSHQSNQSNKSHQSNQSHQSTKSDQSHQTNKSIQSAKSNKSNHSNTIPQSQQSGEAPKSAFSLIYSEQETDEMNKKNQPSPFTRKNNPLNSSDRIDPNSASLSSIKPNVKPTSPTLNRDVPLNKSNDNINKSGLSSQSFSHSPPINDDFYEEEEEGSNISSEKSANIFMKNKDIQLTPSEESSLIRDFPGDSKNSKQENPKNDFPIKSSPGTLKSSEKVHKTKKENSKLNKNEQVLESSSHSNIEFIKNRNINLRQSDESSMINDFPGDTYNNDYTEKKKKPIKQTNNQLNFPRVSSKPINKTNNKKEESPKEKPKLQKKENSIRSEIIQLQASDYSENSKPIFNLDGENSENISKKLRSLKVQNSSSISSSLPKNAQKRMMEEKEEVPDSQSYESNGSNKNKNKTFQPITLNQLSSESDSFNNKLQNKNENKVLQLNDLDDNSSISDNFSNKKNSSKGKTIANNVNRSNQQKNYSNDNDEKASSSNEGKE